jgi:hypothetical protein
MKLDSLRSLALMAAVLFASSYLGTAQDPGLLTNKELYHQTGAEGTITGTITLTGKAPKPRQIDTSADPACGTMNSELLTEDAIVNDGKVANVFVYVQSGDALNLYSFEQPTTAALLERKGCRYEPHVLALRTGQQLAISNVDPTQHNTHPQPKSNLEWNQTQVPGATFIKTFDRPETFIPFRCNQHPWEKAYVGVFSHPFFAVTDESGRYRIEGLPPGTYTLGIWHERFGEKTLAIRVFANETRDADFAFDVADKR